MTVLRALAPIAVIAAGVFAFVVLSRGKEIDSREDVEQQAPLVDIEVAKIHTDGLDIQVDGNVVPFRDIDVPTEVAGRVKEKFAACETGEYVTVGTPLFEIDPKDYNLEKRRLESLKAQAEEDLAEMQVQIENSGRQVKLAQENLDLERREYARSKGLFEKGVITESDFEAAKRAELKAREALLGVWSQKRVYEARKKRLAAAKALVEVQWERADEDLKRTKVTSPIDGVIIAESVEQDGYVQKGALLVTIQDASTMEVKCNLRVEDIYWILQQLPAQDQTAANDRQRQAFKIPSTPATVVFEEVFAWDGSLERLDGVGLDVKTRLVPCRVVVKDPLAVRYIGPADPAHRPVGPSALLRNMYVQVKIHAKPRTELIRVSDKALRPGGSVWVVRDSKLVIVPVSIVKRWRDVVLIDGSASQLKAGDKVVVSPLTGARPDMEVRERDAS